MKYTINDKVEVSLHPVFQKIINNVIWGKSPFNPNNKEKNQELIDEAKQLTYEKD